MKWSCNLLGEHERAAGSDRWLHSQLDFSKLPGVDSCFKKFFLWTVRLTSDFLLSSEKKPHSLSKTQVCPTLSWLQIVILPSLDGVLAFLNPGRIDGLGSALWNTEWITGLTGAREQEESKDNQLLHPSLPKYHKSSCVLGNIAFTKPLSDSTRF